MTSDQVILHELALMIRDQGVTYGTAVRIVARQNGMYPADVQEIGNRAIAYPAQIRAQLVGAMA